jgi:multiple sugar transport system ATP-binding protein
VVLQNGTVQQYDTPEAVYERPSNQFVAGFIGSPAMNFFPVEMRGEQAVFAHDDRAAPIGAENASLLRKAGRAVLGIRPEHFAAITDTAGGATVNIKLVEPLGSDTLIHFDLGGASAIARVEPSLRPKVGDRITLGPQPGRIHLFEVESGAVLR